MCGRYTLTADPEAIVARFGHELAGPEGTHRFNIAPTEPILTVVRERAEDEPKLRLLRWGLVPGWADDVKMGAKMINARSETVGTKEPFRRYVDKWGGRCLIVADGFYEWQKPEDRKQPRQPFRFTVDDGGPFAMAGLWARSKIDGEWLASATILTTAANPLVARVHDRMPVILPDREAEAAWLAPGVSGAEALALCVPLDPARMTASAVSRRVNGIDPDNEGPDLLVPDPPVEGEPALTLF
jgi:putative SOS response-associated peptidase YedK